MITSRAWTAAYLLGILLMAVLVIVNGPGDSRVGVGLSLLAAFALAWIAVGRRAAEGNAAAVAFTALLAVLLGALVAYEPTLATAQFLVFPTVWVIARSYRAGIVGNAAVAAAVAVGFLVSTGTSPEELAQTAATQGLSLTFSIVIGTWIHRIAVFSEERGRLIDELTAAQGELALLHRDAGITEERSRLAREIHDTIAQSLTGLVMLGQRARRELAAGEPREETLELIESAARDALVETRSLVAATAPVELDRGGLADALERLAERFRRETGIAVSVSVSVVAVASAGAPGSTLARDTEVVLLRAAQEGLANVRKHAGASAASLSLVIDDAEAHLTVLDDGRGYDPGSAEPGFGIAGLRDRVALVGGEVSVDGTAGSTRLRVTLPRVAVTA